MRSSNRKIRSVCFRIYFPDSNSTVRWGRAKLGPSTGPKPQELDRFYNFWWGFDWVLICKALAGWWSHFESMIGMWSIDKHESYSRRLAFYISISIGIKGYIVQGEGDVDPERHFLVGPGDTTTSNVVGLSILVQVAHEERRNSGLDRKSTSPWHGRHLASSSNADRNGSIKVY
jgi:hypothetical protein